MADLDKLISCKDTRAAYLKPHFESKEAGGQITSEDFGELVMIIADEFGKSQPSEDDIRNAKNATTGSKAMEYNFDCFVSEMQFVFMCFK